MAETTYKKGELLFNEDMTTDIYGGNSYSTGSRLATSLELNQDVLLVEFNEVQYICEVHQESFANIYGGVTSAGPVFIEYPFAFYKNGEHLQLFTESPGTYSLKIYTAIPDSDSDSSSKSITIRSYIDKNLTHLNWNILPQIFESEGVELTEEIERYLRETPKNTNWNVFKELSNHTPIDLGTLFYQGSLQEGNINEDEGAMVQDVDEWYHVIESCHMYMVIENNTVLGTKTDEHCVSFVFNNSTVLITITTDIETGDSVAVISGDVPSYYEIYVKQVK